MFNELITISLLFIKQLLNQQLHYIITCTSLNLNTPLQYQNQARWTSYIRINGQIHKLLREIFFHHLQRISKGKGKHKEQQQGGKNREEGNAARDHERQGQQRQGNRPATGNYLMISILIQHTHDFLLPLVFLYNYLLF